MASDDEEYSYNDDYEYDDMEMNEDTYYDDGFDSDALGLAAQHDAKKKKGVIFLPAKDFQPLMNQYVTETADITDIALDVATVLLSHYNWSKDKLVEEYCANPDAVLQKCGVYKHAMPLPPLEDNSSKKQRKQQKMEAIRTCHVCYEDEGLAGPFQAMVCGHAFCKDCWKGHVANAIQEEGPTCARTLTCPDAKCPERLTTADVAMALGEDDHGKNLQQKYQLFQLRSFIDASPTTCWCPGKNCDLVASASSLHELECVNKEATCKSCDVSFCVACHGEEVHAPCRCSILKQWKDKCESESMNATWITANTKKCPKCQRRIQKNGGCNHMTCRSGCGHAFCWLCFADWRNHSSCNTYRSGEDRDKPNDDNAKNAQNELERYVHYHDRYLAHDQGQKFAQKKWDELKTAEPEAGTDWDFVELAREANKLLTTSRRVLKYSYAHGFVVFGATGKKSLQQDRFEDKQQQLEAFTERLSGETEKNLKDIEQNKVADLSAALTVFIKNMVECVDDEMDEELLGV